jgi:hypothetical protein
MVMQIVKSRGRSVLSLLLLLVVLVSLASASHAAPGQPPDADSIQSEMERLIDYLDGPAYARAVPWGQHVVLAYRLAQGQDPTAFEFFLFGALRADIGFSRSAVLSVALRGDEPYPTWGQCRDFLQRVRPSDFRPDAAVQWAAQHLAAVPRSEIAATLAGMAAAPGSEAPQATSSVPAATPGTEYNTYFGYLHAHSQLSDGQGTPLEAYEYARDAGQLDFFALTDHGELLMLWPWSHKWEQLVDAAQQTYQPGTYATLWGFEWSNPLLGHLNIINSADYTQCLSNFRISGIYDWLVARPEAFGRFNHPGDFDWLGIEFLHLWRYDSAVPQMVGIENWNSGEGFDHYYYNGSWNNDYSYWDVGNRKGWILGSLGAQDNHDPDWGTMNDFRTAVLAEELTRESVADAYRNRRFYATEDSDLSLDLRCQGYPMGSQLSGVPRQFDVSACDGSGDTFQEVRLYRNGDLLETQPVSGDCFQATFTDPAPTGSDYYYVIVRESDDNDGNGRNDEAISSPIWID